MNKADFSKFNNKKSSFKIALDFLGNLFFIYCVIIALALILFSSVTIECEVFGASMQPTLNKKTANHDYVYVNTACKDLNYGDIVVIDTDDEYIIKRVVGLPGDKISIVLDGGIYKLKRNDDIIDENYIKISNNVTIPAVSRNGMDNTYSHFQQLLIDHPEFVSNNDSILIPDNAIFALGDNRAVSQDSSFYGPFSLSDVLGKVEFIKYAGTSKFKFYYNYILNGGFFTTFINLF